MTRKFASRGKFVGQEVMPYVSLLIVKLLASSITTLKSLVLSCGTTICGLKDISPHAHQWGGEIAILAEAVSPENNHSDSQISSIQVPLTNY